MEYIIYCYHVPASDKERIIRSFEKHAGLQLIDILSIAGLKKIYTEEISGQVFLVFTGLSVTHILPLLKEIQAFFPDLTIVCIGEGLKPEDIALIRGTGTVNYLERAHLDSLYDIVSDILKEKPEQTITEKEVLKQYEFLLDVSDSYLSMIGRNYTYLAINDAFCKAHDLKRQELIGNTPIKLWGEQTFDKVIKPYLDQSFSKKDIHYRAWFDVPGKGKRFFEVMFRPHINEEGEVDYVVVSSKDITSEEKAKELIKRHNEDINLLNILNQMSNDVMPVEQIAKVITERLLDLFQAFTCNIYFHDDRNDILKPVHFGIREGDYPQVKKIMGFDIKRNSVGFDKKSFLYDIIKGYKTVHLTEESKIRRVVYEVGNRSPEIRKHIPAFLEKFPVKAILVIPLRYRSEKLGLMLMSRFTIFSPQEIERINRLANQISFILKHDKEDRHYREQSERIRLLFETAQDAIILMDKYNLLDCNPATLKMFGVKKKNILGKTPLDFSPVLQPGEIPSEKLAKKYIEKTLNGKAQTFEWVHQTASGQPFYTQVKLNLLPLNDRLYIQAIIRDMDEEKKNRIKLEESERSLREAQRIAHLGDWSWDITTGQIRWSDEFFRILGLNPSRDIPSLRMLVRRVHPEDRKRMIQKIVNATRECEKCEDQFRLLMPDGAIKYIKSSGLLEKKKGVVSYWHGVIQDVTSLVEAENALRESENRFRTIFTESFFAMSLLTRYGDFIDTNKACSNLFGYTRKELKRMNCDQMVPEDDKEAVKALFTQLREGKKKSYTGEKKYIRKDGSVVWTQTGITAIMNKDGSLKHLVTTLVNITDRKKAEEKILQQSAELNLINRMNLALNKGEPLQDIIRMMHDSVKNIFPIQNILIFLKDFPGNKEGLKLVYWSFPQELVRKAESVVGDVLGHLVFTKNNSRFLKAVIQSKSPILVSDPEELYQGIEEFFLNKGLKTSGEKISRYFGFRTLIYYPILKEKKLFGTILLFSDRLLKRNILADISRLMEQTNMIILKKLNEDENQQLYTAIEHMNEVLIISDKTGRILYVNEAFEKLMGKKKKTVMGKNTRDLRNPEVDTSVYQSIWDTVMTGNVWTGLLTIRNSSGDNIPTHYHITPIRDGEGTVIYFVTVIRNISQELALERYMQRSQKLEMIGRFAGGLAHDFNNILATMLGYTDMVLEEVEKDSCEARYLEKIKSSGLRAQDLIQQLLTFNRGIEPEKENIDPGKILQESLDLLATQIPRKVKITFHKTGNIPVIQADPIQLRQVFINLLGNAAHAVETRKNDATLEVELKIIKATQKLRQKLPDINRERYLRILVRDNGTGMEKEVLDKIFEPFFTTKPVGKGSGMGLSVVHGIIKNHEGAVQVESHPGKGTSFWVYLPVT